MSAPARFGRLARIYRWMEYLSFGPWLMRCRTLRLAEMTQHGSALVYGDGDGRFVAALARRAPAMAITSVDASRAMLRQAAKQLPARGRVRLQQADALRYLPSERYELIVSHFFFDCFDEAELAELVAHASAAALPGAVWVVSDFALPVAPIARWLGKLIISGLYLSFGALTGLKTRRLPDHPRVLRDAGWTLEERQPLLAGLLVSERWRFAENRPRTKQIDIRSNAEGEAALPPV